MQLATVLGVPVGKLLGETATPPAPQGKAATGNAIYRALTGPVPAPYELPSLAELQEHVVRAWETWQTSPYRYTKLTAQLPVLITDTELSLRDASTGERRAAWRCAADLHFLLRTVAKRIGRVDLSLLAADRAVRAGEAADDPLRVAAARWNLTQVLLADNEAEGAESVAMHAADDLRPEMDRGDLDAVALCGALLLIAAVAAARQGNAWTAHERLRQAEPLAARTGERNSFWTVFGPTNLDMYRVALAVETGQAAEGLRLAEQVHHDRSPSIERRVAFLLDQAKGYEQRQDFASALVMLQTAEREAPEDMAYRPSAHSAIKAVIQRGRRSVAAEAVRLAARVGVPI
jgi:hypothetical protein